MSPRPPRVDLHAHSSASDGELAPEALVARAASLGLSALAVTDHDTLAGLPAARAAGERLGIEVIPGIELSASMEGAEVHILGLFIDPSREPDTLAELRRRRRQRVERILERLEALGIRLDPALVAAASTTPLGKTETPANDDGAVGRPHVARALVAAGVVKTVAEAFSRYLRDQGPADVPKDRMSAREALETIHGMGGLAFLAHPGVFDAERHLDGLRSLGLDGVEAYHPKHSGETTARLLRWAGCHGMAVSGGSDFHAPGNGMELGKPVVPLSVLDGLRARRG